MTDFYLMGLALIGDRTLTDEVLAEVMATLAAMPKIQSADLAAVKKRLETTIGVAMSKGVGLTDRETAPWVEDIKASTEWNYWNSYVTQRKSDGFAAAVLRTLDEDTDNILTECGNPANQNGWRVQGLVMGDVQSGKTASYCGLISKAADTGYRVIVLLTGMIEDLRSQSQERLDEGFVGKDSRELLKGEIGTTRIGVGRYRQQTPNVLTSIDSDFLKSNQRALRGIPLENIKEPVLLVMKKNKSALENLLSFLGKKPTGAEQLDQLDLPLLVVDDEADNASVNAKKDEDPATINRLIRDLIGKFRRATYVAYTATPFANVFINPDGSDLFPRNFVYSLNTPSNYIGAGSIFSESGEQDHQLVEIADAGAIFPEKHLKTLQVDVLPQSLQDAIGTFLLSCAIRDLRAEVLKHRSMLINATRFSDVQEQLTAVVKNSLYVLVEDIKQYLADDLWGNHPSLKQLHSLYMKHYRDCGVAWDSVRAKLYDSIASVKVLTINQRTDKSERLNYRAYKTSEKGRRVIAIGGLTLSRGLTLEGLCVSYFYRNSKAYDTLLQMGRWFGYRPGYADLCRIWMTSEAQDWFTHIADVVAELRDDIKRMHANRSPPSEFGMRVRSHPKTLLITAANKMRNSEEVKISLSFSHTLTETPFLPKTAQANNDNARAVSSFLRSLGAAAKPEGSSSRHLWRGVKAKDVADFLEQLEIPAMNYPFIADAQTGERPIIRFIRENTVLKDWDICLAGGAGEMAGEIEFLDQDGRVTQVRKQQRQFQKPSSRSVNYLMVNKQRVGDIADEKVLLTRDQIRKAEEDWIAHDETRKEKKVPGRAYVRVREYPLLTIHPIEPTDPKKEGKSAERILKTESIEPRLLIGLSLSTPGFEESDAASVTYSLNKVYLRSLGLFDDEDEDENEEQD